MTTMTITIICTGGTTTEPPTLSAVTMTPSGGTAMNITADSFGNYPVEFTDDQIDSVTYGLFEIIATDGGGGGNSYDLFLAGSKYANTKIEGWVSPGEGVNYTIWVTNPVDGPPLDPKLVIRNVQSSGTESTNPPDSGNYRLYGVADGVDYGYLTIDSKGFVMLGDDSVAMTLQDHDTDDIKVVSGPNGSADHYLHWSPTGDNAMTVPTIGSAKWTLSDHVLSSKTKTDHQAYVDPVTRYCYACTADTASAKGFKKLFIMKS